MQSLDDKSLHSTLGVRPSRHARDDPRVCRRAARTSRTRSSALGGSHADYFLELAENAGLCVEGIEAGSGESGYQTVLPERDNLRAAIDFYLQADEIEAATRLAVSLEQYWVTNSPDEGARVLGRLCGRREELPPELRVRAIRSLAGCIYIQGRLDEGARLCEEALELYRQLGDEWGIAHMLLRTAVDEEPTRRWREGEAAARGELVPLELTLQ